MDATQITPGRFCWVELGTKDDKAATGFYSELFGWKTEVAPMGEGMGDYTMLRLGDKDVGGAYKLLPMMLEQGVPPHWLSYVAVESADASTEKATALGATLIMGPLDVMEIGRMSILQDPTGAGFALWQAKTHRGSQASGEPGAVCWNELLTSDPLKAGAFYAELFGWELQEQQMGPINYTMLMNGDTPAGGMMAISPEMGPMPPNWLVYFAVDDCDGDVERAQTLGGKTFVPPMEVPGVGRMAALADPQGAAFAIIKLVDGPESDAK